MPRITKRELELENKSIAEENRKLKAEIAVLKTKLKKHETPSTSSKAAVKTDPESVIAFTNLGHSYLKDQDDPWN